MKNEIEQKIFEKIKAKDFGESMCNETKLNVLKWTMQQLRKHFVMQQREQLFDFLRWYSDVRELNYSDSHILVMIDKYQKSNNCA